MKPKKDFATALQEVQEAFRAIRAEGRQTIKIIQEGNRYYTVIESSPRGPSFTIVPSKP